MSKHLEILENFDKLSKPALITLVGQILTTAEDVAYAYDITEEMTERLKEDLDEFVALQDDQLSETTSAIKELTATILTIDAEKDGVLDKLSKFSSISKCLLINYSFYLMIDYTHTRHQLLVSVMD